MLKGGTVSIKTVKNSLNLSDGVTSALEMAAKFEEEERMHDKPKEVSPSLKSLCLFGKVSKRIDFGEHFVEISTLTNKDQRTLLKKLLMFEPSERLSKIKDYTLAMVITSLDGVPLEDHYLEEDNLDNFSKKLWVIQSLQSNLVEWLFDQYDLIAVESKDLFPKAKSEDDIKN